ncbi:hypothetical protein Lal_00049924, partial [Lupinus albus]
GVDVFLGLEWLASLGEVKADFGKMRLSVKREGEIMTIVGNPALIKAELTDVEVLVKWQNFPQHDSTWETTTSSRDNFPKFQLEDKLRSLGGGWGVGGGGWG